MANIGNKIRPGYRCTNYELNSLPFIGHWKFTFFDSAAYVRGKRDRGKAIERTPGNLFRPTNESRFLFIGTPPAAPPAALPESEQLRQNSYYKSQDSRIVIRFLLCLEWYPNQPPRNSGSRWKKHRWTSSPTIGLCYVAAWKPWNTLRIFPRLQQTIISLKLEILRSIARNQNFKKNLT